MISKHDFDMNINCRGNSFYSQINNSYQVKKEQSDCRQEERQGQVAKSSPEYIFRKYFLY